LYLRDPEYNLCLLTTLEYALLYLTVLPLLQMLAAWLASIAGLPASDD
jgi:hypothetical protein